MVSPVAFGRLQNVIKYCIKCVKRVRSRIEPRSQVKSCGFRRWPCLGVVDEDFTFVPADFHAVISSCFYSVSGGVMFVAAANRLLTLLRYSIAFCRRPKVSSDAIFSVFVRQIVPDNTVKFSGPCFHRYREISVKNFTVS